MRLLWHNTKRKLHHAARLGMFALFAWITGTHAAQPITHAAQDTLNTQRIEARNPETRAMLDRLSYPLQKFDVNVKPAELGQPQPLHATFPSPKPQGRDWLDAVPLEIHRAQDRHGQLLDQAPAVLFVHSLHPQRIMAVGLARAVSTQGIHGVVVTLPGFADRRDPAGRHFGVVALVHGEQAVADVRRARDAVASLPFVQPDAIMLHGTSLGGVVATLAAGLDGAFPRVVLLATGANTRQLLDNPRKDAWHLKQAILRAGISDPRLKNMLDRLEPARLASRLPTEQTWLYTPRLDEVFPRSSSDALAQAIALPEPNRIWLEGNHYTAMFALPALAQDLVDHAKAMNKKP